MLLLSQITLSCVHVIDNSVDSPQSMSMEKEIGIKQVSEFCLEVEKLRHTGLMKMADSVEL